MLRTKLLALLLSVVQITGESVISRTDPTHIGPLTEGVSVLLRVNYSCTEEAELIATIDDSDTYNIADITNGHKRQVCANLTTEQDRTWPITVTGVFIGITSLSVRSQSPNLVVPPTTVLSGFVVSVVREKRVLNTVFTYVIYSFLILGMVGFGCELDLEIVKEILKKPVAPIIGFVCQYGLMPVISYAITALVSMPPEMGLGLFAVGCCPGGGPSNMWTLLLEGDTSLSLTMTFFSTAAALVMMPLWMLTLGQQFISSTVSIPYSDILIALAAIIVPGFVGILIKKFKPKAANIIRKCIRPMSVIILLFLLTAGVYSNLYMFTVMSDWKILVGAMLLPYTGFILSAIVAAIAQQPANRIMTIMIETGVQSAGIAVIILRTTLRQPEGDLASVIPFATLMFTPIPLFTSVIAYRLWKCHRKKQRVRDNDQRDDKSRDSVGESRDSVDMTDMRGSKTSSDSSDVGADGAEVKLENSKVKLRD